jgi:hypothetical protein
VFKIRGFEGGIGVLKHGGLLYSTGAGFEGGIGVHKTWETT